ncbi:uncharacterized protein LOC117653169 [Thrips palmi]|uniref:Uncharacterized protein LOC117653169 n=1 Tax=Thrips palmi TaxID=161013 RepID=A0A6P9AAL9_THRPL|nr:uncharacterized protein LOC117653169 [Thrips palmi]
MPQRCSIPGCKTGYKQGLMLLCYPKDPERRNSWVQGVRKVGLEPTNMQFICELHFGPDQWEKIRVDGTRKLKWSGVPNMFTPEEVATTLELVRSISKLRERPQGPVKRKGNEDQQEPKPEAKVAFSPNVIRRVVKLDKICKSIEAPLATTKFQLPVISKPPSEVAQSSLFNEEVIEAPSSIVNVSSPTEDPLSSQTSAADAISGEKTSAEESILPLSCPSHSIIVKLPKSRYQSSLMEDLDDLKSFLNASEHTYEQRLINSLAQLVKKHEQLDEKLQRCDKLLGENSLLKEKMKDHQKVLLENYTLREKIRKYEQKSMIENVILREKLGGNNGTVIRIEKIIDPTPQINRACETVKRVKPCVSLVNPNTLKDQEAGFVSLEDQL